MKYLTIDDITIILKKVREIAQAQRECETCPFYNIGNDTCVCEEHIPCCWEDNI